MELDQVAKRMTLTYIISVHVSAAHTMQFILLPSGSDGGLRLVRFLMLVRMHLRNLSANDTEGLELQSKPAVQHHNGNKYEWRQHPSPTSLPKSFPKSSSTILDTALSTAIESALARWETGSASRTYVNTGARLRYNAPSSGATCTFRICQ